MAERGQRKSVSEPAESVSARAGVAPDSARASGTEPFDLRSHAISDEKLGELIQLFPEAKTEDGKIDFNRLKLTLGEAVDSGKERYGLTWPGKADCFTAIQTPSLGTLLPAPKESVNWDSTENMIVEGDNLEVLKLLQKAYLGKVKVIYIDPPYNTGNDFIYPDNYAESLQTYLEYTGQVDSQGKKFSTNSDTEGRFHSRWLNLMYPRLYLARNLLAEKGVILVSIDDSELSALRLVMNEVFGEESFKNCIVIKRGAKSVQAQFDSIDSLASGHEYVLLYAKSPVTRFKNFAFELAEKREGVWNNHWRGTERPTMRYELFGVTPRSGQWRWSKERSAQAIKNYELLVKELGAREGSFPEDRLIDEWWEARRARTGEELDLLRLSKSGKPEHYIAASMTKVGSDLWTDIPSNGSSELKALLGKILFDNPKPVQLVRRMIDWLTDPREGALVLDFFSGSGTTAQAVIEANTDDGGNRRFIMVQLPEPTHEESEARRAGFLTISSICEERVRRVIKESGSEAGFRTYRLAESNFKPWDSARPEHADALQRRLTDHVHHIREGRSDQDILTELLLKSGSPPTTRISEVSVGAKKAYKVADGRLTVCLDRHLTLEAIRAIAELRPERVVCLDEGFEGNDQLKVNAAQTFKTKGVTSFQTV